MHSHPDSTDVLPSSTDLTFLMPERAAARAIQRIEWNEGENRTVHRDAIADLLEIECKAVADGDMTMVRRTLAAQIRVLERLYDHLLDRAMGMGPVVDVYDKYLKLAFRAQSQLNRTIALLERYSRPVRGEGIKAVSKAAQPRGECVVPRGEEEASTPPESDLDDGAFIACHAAPDSTCLEPT